MAIVFIPAAAAAATAVAAANAPRAGMKNTRPFSEDSVIPMQLASCPAVLKICILLSKNMHFAV